MARMGLRAAKAPPPTSATAFRGRRDRAMKQRGLTLIELTIALTIVALLFAAVVTGMGLITGSRARAAGGEVGGGMRPLYHTSALTGKTCRPVFLLSGALQWGNPARD